MYKLTDTRCVLKLNFVWASNYTPIYLDANMATVYRRLAREWCPGCNSLLCGMKCKEGCKYKFNSLDYFQDVSFIPEPDYAY